jgi:RNA polymerase sigma factor (sigma-70 family)
MSNANKAQGRIHFETHYALIQELVRCLSRRHRLSTDEREDFTSYAMLKLVEDDYRRLRKYRGDSSLRTYLTVVLQRLFLDYRTEKWGKWRPSTTAKRLGSTAMKLESLLYRDGVDFQEAREMLLARPDTTECAESLWTLALELPRRERPKRMDEEVLANVGSAGRADDLVRREQMSLIRSLESRLVQESGRLTAEERTILRMRFDDGKSVPEIAEALELRPKALYGRIARLLRQLRLALESSGVSWRELDSIVGSRDVGLNLERIFDGAVNQSSVSV